MIRASPGVTRVSLARAVSVLATSRHAWSGKNKHALMSLGFMGICALSLAPLSSMVNAPTSLLETEYSLRQLAGSMGRLGCMSALFSAVSLALPFIEIEAFRDASRLQLARHRLEFFGLLNYEASIGSVSDIHVASTVDSYHIPVRLYRPSQTLARKNTEASLDPLLIWVHGGGWTLGSIESDDLIVRRLVEATGSMVASVGYRLAPQQLIPDQVQDIRDVAIHFLRNGTRYGVDSSRVALAGESAGGHLTLLTALELVRMSPSASEGRGFGLCGVLPVVPATLYGCETESCDRYSHGFFLTKEQTQRFWDHALGWGQVSGEEVSPLLAPAQDLAKLPPMFVITASHDPLRDEGEAFVERVRESGARVVEHVRFENTIHGFFGRRLTYGHEGVLAAAEWFTRTCVEARHGMPIRDFGVKDVVGAAAV